MQEHQTLPAKVLINYKLTVGTMSSGATVTGSSSCGNYQLRNLPNTNLILALFPGRGGGGCLPNPKCVDCDAASCSRWFQGQPLAPANRCINIPCECEMYHNPCTQLFRERVGTKTYTCPVWGWKANVAAPVERRAEASPAMATSVIIVFVLLAGVTIFNV